MKNILVLLAVALIIFNVTLLDYSPFQGDSVVAFIELQPLYVLF
jgi:uncharacterized membrane protein YkgB